MTYINPLWYTLISLFIIQFVLAIYVFINANKYQLNPLLWGLIVLFVPNFMGIVIYFIVRNQSKGKKACHHCGRFITKEDHYCPNCGADQSIHCANCAYPIHENWKFCPNCSHQL